jgi:hypothetical protein
LAAVEPVLMKSGTTKADRDEIGTHKQAAGGQVARKYSQSKPIKADFDYTMRNYLQSNGEFSWFAMESSHYICYKAVLDV